MIELETLRPEVRESLAIMDRDCPETIDWQRTAWGIIRAELLRLTDDCARLVDCINAQPPTRRSLIDRAERAEAELAALKARIFQGIVLDVDDLARGHAGLPSEWRGKRVRLVVEE